MEIALIILAIVVCTFSGISAKKKRVHHEEPEQEDGYGVCDDDTFSDFEKLAMLDDFLDDD